jgi:hypothetical protein
MLKRYAYEDNCLVGIVLVMETASTSETSENFYQTTRRNIPERQSSSYKDTFIFLHCLQSNSDFKI